MQRLASWLLERSALFWLSAHRRSFYYEWWDLRSRHGRAYVTITANDDSWCPTADRLPDDYGHYFVRKADGRYDVAEHVPGCKHWHNVTHWQPIVGPDD